MSGLGVGRGGQPCGMSSPRIAVIDLDGTLVDTNYHHAVAWYRALRSLGETFPLWRIHRRIGMGGDQFVAALGGDEVEERIGDAARERWVEEFDLLIDEIAVLPGARELLVEDWTTSDDVEATKPAPDLLQVALQKLGEPLDAPSVMIGDSVYDVEAAANAGMPAVVVRSGGVGDDELRDAGAVAIVDTPGDLRDALGDLDVFRT